MLKSTDLILTDDQSFRQERLNPKVWWVWTISDLMVCSILLLLIVFFSSELRSTSPWFIYVLILAACITIFTAINISLHSYNLKSWLISLDREELKIQNGVLVKNLILMPINRIQHVDIREGILERLSGLKSIRIATAAETTNISGLTAEQAKNIQQTLVDKVKQSENYV